MKETILLFDIDGTLLVSARRSGYRSEVRRAIASVFGTAGRLDQVRFDGKTDLAILREALEPEGVTPAMIRDRLPDWERGFVELTERLGRDGPLFVRCPGVGDLLDAVDADARFALSVLTGNLETMAHAKLASVTLDPYFRLRGAYGSDRENRNDLPPIASERITAQLGRTFEPIQFVIIGDTPRDIEAARSFGMRCLAVATGHYSVEDLAAYAPDAVVSDLCDVDSVLAFLAR